MLNRITQIFNPDSEVSEAEKAACLKRVSCVIDTEQVGEFIGNGFEHIVFDYGDDEVAKVPRENQLIPRLQGLARNLYGYSQLEGIDKYRLETDFRSRGLGYVLIQKKLEGCRYLTEEVLQDPELMEQLQEIIDYNERVLKPKKLSIKLFDPENNRQGRSDFFGGILLDENRQLRITDFDLLDWRYLQFRNPASAYNCSNWITMQDEALKKMGLI
ncbi:hypothetical protein KKG16_02030 [Patescibacteria group bacterium]|nr:hypothetical protein [Patescibacteria group bacterium]